MSRLTSERSTEHISRLYEQGADLEHIEEYTKHWFKWVKTGIRKKELSWLDSVE